MLLEFTLRNYRSFRDETTFSLVAGSGTEHQDTHTLPIPRFDGERAVRSAVLYGPNASGKTNLLLALDAMRKVVVTSASQSQRGDAITAVEPFRLSAETREAPTLFEVDFVQEVHDVQNELEGDVRFQYGFEATQERIVEEWLYAYPKGQAQRWFTRAYDVHHTDGAFKPGEYLRGNRRQIWEATRPNALFLSTAAQLNNETLAPIFDWFRENVLFRSAGNLKPRKTLEACGSPSVRKKVLTFLQNADLGIQNVHVDREEVDLNDGVIHHPSREFIGFDPDTNVATLMSVRFTHADPSSNETDLQLDEESHGTQRYFALAGPILDVLRKGQILAIDELDSSLHPLMVRAIVNLFHDSASNPNGAQLLFNTHDVTLLDQDLFRRDQIWFTEKFDDGATRLVPLLDFKPRKGTEALEKNYLQGRYGALPMLRLDRIKSLFHHGETSEE